MIGAKLGYGLAAIASLIYLSVMIAAGRLPPRGHLIVPQRIGIVADTPSDIVTVTVQADQHKCTFRRNDQWMDSDSHVVLTSKHRLALEHALKLLHKAAPVRTIPPEQLVHSELAQFGLKPPRLSIALENTHGEIVTIDFGATTIDGNQQYAQRSDRSAIYVVSGFLASSWQWSCAGGGSLARARTP